MKNSTKIVSTRKAVLGTATGTIQYSFCMLAAVLMLSTRSVAQHQNKSTSKQSAKASATPVSATMNYKVMERNGKIILSDGKSETLVSANPHASSPVVSGDNVFYIARSEGNNYSSGSSIYVYNIKTKRTGDILSPNATAANYDLKNEVINLLQDKKSGNLYFSTSSKNKRGHTEFLTWSYDISSQTLAVYKDGRIESIDETGIQTIVFEGFDSKGRFTSKTLVSADGNTIKVLGKEYAAQTIK